MASHLVDQSTLKMQVYKYLRDRIFSGDLPAGQRLVITDIAEKLNVSLTPVREAVSQLTVEGYVDTLPRKGTFVKELSNREFLDAYEVLGVLDAYAAEKAASRISDKALKELERLTREMLNNDSIDHYVECNWRIHGLMAEESGNQALVAIVTRLREEVTRYRYVSLTVDRRIENPARSIGECWKPSRIGIPRRPPKSCGNTE
jgi:DNA-binding GntR family transcriptional regulator